MESGDSRAGLAAVDPSARRSPRFPGAPDRWLRVRRRCRNDPGKAFAPGRTRTDPALSADRSLVELTAPDPRQRPDMKDGSTGGWCLNGESAHAPSLDDPLALQMPVRVAHLRSLGLASNRTGVLIPFQKRFDPGGNGCARSRRGRNGQGGIRTLGTLLGHASLAKKCFRPLSHLTLSKNVGSANGWKTGADEKDARGGAGRQLLFCLPRKKRGEITDHRDARDESGRVPRPIPRAPRAGACRPPR